MSLVHHTEMRSGNGYKWLGIDFTSLPEIRRLRTGSLQRMVLSDWQSWSEIVLFH